MNRITPAQVLDNIHRLPSLPGVVNELILAMSDESLRVDDLAHGIEKDQALSARALRVANSPFYGLPKPVSSIHDAVVVLGFRAVGSLVTTAALTDFFRMPALDWFDPSTFWHHSLGAAVCGRKLAARAGMDPEVGFTAGLLHDIGRLLLVVGHTRQYQATLAWRDAHDAPLIQAERAVLELTHAEAGAALAGHWNFPPEIQNAVAFHHQPDQAPEPRPAYLAHLSDALAQGLDLARDQRAIAPPLVPDVLTRLGLDWAAVAGSLAGIEAEFEGYECLLSGTA
ncbi:MAG: HDOD domain-containing protein [Pseudomonadota bacterium]